MVQTAHRLHIAHAHGTVEGALPRSRPKVVSVMMTSRMQTVNSNVFRIPSVPTRHCPVADFLNLGWFDGIGNLYHPVSWKPRDQSNRLRTLIMICEESCPPSEESRLPGNPADSQFEHMSTETQATQ